jgi:flagellin
MRINTNLPALNTHRLMGQTNDAIARSIGRLSSGYRINNAKDDAAGLAIANKFRADIRAFRVAQQNTTEANSLLQIAESGASSIGSILERMKELATQAASANSNGQQGRLDEEFTALKAEMDRIVGSTTYQGQELLKGSTSLTFQIGVAVTAPTTAPGGGTPPAGNTVSNKSDGTGITDLSITWESDADDTLEGLAAGTYTLEVSGSTDDLTLTVKDAGGTAVFTETGMDADGQNVTADITIGGVKVGEFTLTDGFDSTSNGGPINAFTVTAPSGGTGGGTSPADPHDRLTLSLSTALDVAGLFTAEPEISDQATAQATLDVIDGAMDKVNEFLGQIGAYQNRLDYASANIAATIENYSASESAIRDADMAFEMTNFTRNQIMQQAAIAMLAQANAAPQGVLRLLG